MNETCLLKPRPTHFGSRRGRAGAFLGQESAHRARRSRARRRPPSLNTGLQAVAHCADTAHGWRRVPAAQDGRNAQWGLGRWRQVGLVDDANIRYGQAAVLVDFYLPRFRE